MADASTGGVTHLPLLPVKPGGVAFHKLLPQTAAAAGDAFGGALTLLAFDAGAQLATHSTPHEAMIIVQEGVAEATLNGKAHALRPGDALQLPAGAPHSVRAIGGKMCMLLAKARAAERAQQGAAAADAPPLPSSPS